MDACLAHPIIFNGNPIEEALFDHQPMLHPTFLVTNYRSNMKKLNGFLSKLSTGFSSMMSFSRMLFSNDISIMRKIQFFSLESSNIVPSQKNAKVM